MWAVCTVFAWLGFPTRTQVGGRWASLIGAERVFICVAAVAVLLYMHVSTQLTKH